MQKSADFFWCAIFAKSWVLESGFKLNIKSILKSEQTNFAFGVAFKFKSNRKFAWNEFSCSENLQN